MFPLTANRSTPAEADTGAAAPKYCNGNARFPPRFRVRLILFLNDN